MEGTSELRKVKVKTMDGLVVDLEVDPNVSKDLTSYTHGVTLC